ncbi:hypothetical protein LX16_0074 [Stackebrandtia albiflava]|uniref:Uncharacterized protein n=1 Tax=Stackebrandtia albiflava TaxID=406432 RepID=A0A562VH18_9ACTN|nr:hypothetical protein [Stackebrandtia albiflava]TWJ17158.1 hypothetical protein LX16_0074 [Stackebrandtia albiflava]
MNQPPDYDQLLYRLERLRERDSADTRSAHERVDALAARAAACTDRANELRGELVDTAARLRAGVPDLRAAVDPTEAAPADVETELAAADAALRLARQRQQAAVRTAQLPPLFPKAPPVLRNLVVYSAAMLVAVVAQVLLLRVSAAGHLPGDWHTWIIVMPPVVMLIAGYVATTAAGTPRVPMTDRHGDPLPFTVYKSPRLGAGLAVLTVVAVLLWQLGAW